MFTDEETGRERQDNLQESTYEGLTSTHVSLHFCKDFPEDSSDDSWWWPAECIKGTRAKGSFWIQMWRNLGHRPDYGVMRMET